ncbi:uncharacterized protein LOC100369011 [Saccoglossus kowalevskii]|uniref:protein-tyrosine-phosphatase n=1 Tax=Saccoglossus kowalevskii TaxID=10224 RepID=A0ABM0LTY2_SACKO|nr:PREDICTED: uncharacterized protein LOC100369011 [Saccoglossus kowalevskii]
MEKPPSLLAIIVVLISLLTYCLHYVKANGKDDANKNNNGVPEWHGTALSMGMDIKPSRQVTFIENPRPTTMDVSAILNFDKNTKSNSAQVDLKASPSMIDSVRQTVAFSLKDKDNVLPSRLATQQNEMNEKDSVSNGGKENVRMTPTPILNHSVVTKKGAASVEIYPTTHVNNKHASSILYSEIRNDLNIDYTGVKPSTLVTQHEHHQLLSSTQLKKNKISLSEIHPTRSSAPDKESAPAVNAFNDNTRMQLTTSPAASHLSSLSEGILPTPIVDNKYQSAPQGKEDKEMEAEFFSQQPGSVLERHETVTTGTTRTQIFSSSVDMNKKVSQPTESHKQSVESNVASKYLPITIVPTPTVPNWPEDDKNYKDGDEKTVYQTSLYPDNAKRTPALPLQTVTRFDLTKMETNAVAMTTSASPTVNNEVKPGTRPSAKPGKIGRSSHLLSPFPTMQSNAPISQSSLDHVAKGSNRPSHVTLIHQSTRTVTDQAPHPSEVSNKKSKVLYLSKGYSLRPMATQPMATQPMATKSHFIPPTSASPTINLPVGKSIATKVPDKIKHPTTTISSKATIKPSIFPSVAYPTYPEIYIKITMMLSWSEFCPRRQEFISNLVKIAEQVSAIQTKFSVVLLNDYKFCDKDMVNMKRKSEVSVDLYYAVKMKYNKKLTIKSGFTMESNLHYFGNFEKSIHYISISGVDVQEPTQSMVGQSAPYFVGWTIGICISTAVFLFCIISGTYKIRKIRLRRMQMASMYASAGESVLTNNMSNEDTVQLTPITMQNNGETKKIKKKSRNSLLAAINHAMELDEPSQQVLPSHSLSSESLSKFYTYTEAIEEEFQSLPDPVAKTSEMPSGVEKKNRYSNVIPPAKSRVQLTTRIGETNSEYINANFVKGYNGQRKAYIATQAPLENTLENFWRLVWEQQSRVIIMLTDIQENGIKKCYQYWPTQKEGLLSSHLYGDYLISVEEIQKKEYCTVSTLLMKDIEKNLCRRLTHHWFTAWPYDNVPDQPVSVVSFLLDTRQYIHEHHGPVIVHCSAGTGRTGTVIAVDIGMRGLEDTLTVNVPNTVCLIRQDRSHAVQTKEQYNYIYQALQYYAERLRHHQQTYLYDSDEIDEDLSVSPLDDKNPLWV